MSDDQQPRAEWIFPEEKKSNTGKIWLIVGLSILALVIVGGLLFFLLPRTGEADPTPSPTATESSTPSPDPTPISTPEPTSEPVPTQPPVQDPDLETFTAQVQPRLDDAVRGLQLVTENIDLGAQIVESLQNDAETFSDAAAPSSIAGDWSDSVAIYASKLRELRAAYDSGADLQASLDATSAALQQIRALVKL